MTGPSSAVPQLGLKPAVAQQAAVLTPQAPPQEGPQWNDNKQKGVHKV